MNPDTKTAICIYASIAITSTIGAWSFFDCSFGQACGFSTLVATVLLIIIFIRYMWD